MTFKEYLHQVTVEVSKHGRDVCVPCDEPQAMPVGFSSPDGVFQIGINMIKAHFATGEWREDVDLQAAYAAMGGKTPLRAMTRLPSKDVVAALMGEALSRAIAEGELIFNAKNDPNRARA